MRRGPVVLFQPDHLRAGEILLEPEDVGNLGSAPGIDRLVIVPHHADVLVPLRQQPQPQILDRVGVLIFVHHDVAEAALVIGEDVVVCLQDGQHVQHQIAEIAGVQLLKALLIAGIEGGALAVGVGLVLGCIEIGWAEAAVLPAVDQPGQLARGPALIVKLGLGDQLLQQAQLIVGVDDGVIVLQPDELGMAAQHLGADRVEGAEPRQALGRRAQVVRHALAHLARGLVGEGDAQNLRRVGAARRHQMRKPGGERRGLPCASAREHQHRALCRKHGGALRRVQPRGIGRHRLGGSGGGGQGLAHRLMRTGREQLQAEQVAWRSYALALRQAAPRLAVFAPQVPPAGGGGAMPGGGADCQVAGWRG